MPTRNLLEYTITAVLLVALLGATDAARGQSCSFAMPEDPTPLLRPRPMTTMSGGDPQAAIVKITSIMKAEGFEIEEASHASGEIHARAGLKDGEERVVVWIERHLTQPTTKFNVYMQFGRYQQVMGEEDLRRVRSAQTARVTKLRRALLRGIGAAS